jgi:hypothetical protein
MLTLIDSPPWEGDEHEKAIREIESVEEILHGIAEMPKQVRDDAFRKLAKTALRYGREQDSG